MAVLQIRVSRWDNGLAAMTFLDDTGFQRHPKRKLIQNDPVLVLHMINS
jgi:hypothetical protein